MSYKGSYKGLFFPKNPTKYKGNIEKIVFRSLWERSVMNKLDTWDQVISWSSEETSIPYRSPLDGRIHRYFPDFLVTLKTPTGIKNAVLEVKPKKQVLEPKKPKRITKRFINEVKEWGINQAKWDAARNWCADKGVDFIILTEEEIFGKKHK